MLQTLVIKKLQAKLYHGVIITDLKLNAKLIIITTKDSLPGRVYVYVEEANRSQIDEMLNKFIDKKNYHPKDFFEIIIFKLKPYLNLTDEK